MYLAEPIMTKESTGFISAVWGWGVGEDFLGLTAFASSCIGMCHVSVNGAAGKVDRNKDLSSWPL